MKNPMGAMGGQMGQGPGQAPDFAKLFIAERGNEK